MAKLITMFLVLIALQACLSIFQQGGTTIENQSIWDFILNFDNWNNVGFILSMVGIALGVGLVGAAIGSFVGFKTDFLIFALAIPGFLGMGIVFTNLGNLLRTTLISILGISCDVSNCAFITYIVGISVGVLAFYYVWTVIEWWRGKD